MLPELLTLGQVRIRMRARFGLTCTPGRLHYARQHFARERNPTFDPLGSHVKIHL